MVGEPSGERVRLLVLYGGRSAEHEVSCISALHVVRAVDPSRYDVRAIGITTDGRWVDATPALRGGSTGQALPLLLICCSAARVLPVWNVTLFRYARATGTAAAFDTCSSSRNAVP